jgi:hypothetical protein
MASLTASTHYVIPALIGRGLTEGEARSTLGRAKIFGETTASVGGTRVLTVKFTNGKFTIGAVH